MKIKLSLFTILAFLIFLPTYNAAEANEMYFYKDANNNYVLCKDDNNCATYTLDQLVANGATLISDTVIQLDSNLGPGQPDIIYNYNASKAPQAATENNQESTTIDINDSQYCGKLKEPLKFVGNIIVIVKIAIPIIIIAYGMMDFFKAVVGSKDDEIKKSMKSLLYRVIAGVIIFLIPTLVSVVFSLIDSWVDIKGEFNACQKCVLNVKECK